MKEKDARIEDLNMEISRHEADPPEGPRWARKGVEGERREVERRKGEVERRKKRRFWSKQRC